jgi:hypothetical protein
MLRRLYFTVITGFWITMNVLLWKSEFRKEGELGAPVPVRTVWEKMLRTPDDSNLEIFHHKKRIGSCRWSANADEAVTSGRRMSEEVQPEGMMGQLASYTIDVQDGMVDLGEDLHRLRFSLSSRFSISNSWEEFHLNISQRPNLMEIQTRAKEQTMGVRVQDESGVWNRSFTFAELRDPERMLKEFAPSLPLPLSMLTGGLAANLGGGSPGKGQNSAFALDWHAHYDWLKLGHAKLRVYRLQSRLIGKKEVVVLVSRIGEILRVELPDEVVLINSSLVNQ